MSSRSPLRRIAAGLALVALVALWRLLAPVPVGGTVSYVITHGISMLPEYEAGDLVLVRKAESYSVGDVIAYRSENLDQPVLHRIVEAGEDSYVTKGDNNSWFDSDHPSDADVMGKRWAHLPGAGNWLQKARSPVGATLLLGLLALSFFMGNGRKKKEKQAGSGPQMAGLMTRSLDAVGKRAVSGAAALAVLFVVAGIYGFTRPTTRPIVGDAGFSHVGTFGYNAKVARSPVYPDGSVGPDQPIFLTLVDQLDVTFDYVMETTAEANVSGEALVFARVTGASGWKKAVPVARRTAIREGNAHLEGTLDLEAIQRYVTEVQTITGLPESEQTLELVGRVAIDGEVASERVDDEFVPILTFSLSAHQLQPKHLPVTQDEPPVATDEPAAPEDPLAFLTKTQPGQISTSRLAANDVDLLGASVPVSSLRRFSLLGLVICLGAMLLAWIRFSQDATRADEASRISTRYGDWLIPVEAVRSRPSDTIVQVTSMEALARLAETYERMILHEESAEGAHSYYVEQEGTLYCYSITEAAVSPIGSARKETREQRRKEEADLLRKELTEIEAEVLRQEAGSKDD